MIISVLPKEVGGVPTRLGTPGVCSKGQREQPAFFLLQPPGVACQAEGSRGLGRDDSAHGWSHVLEPHWESRCRKPPAALAHAAWELTDRPSCTERGRPHVLTVCSPGRTAAPTQPHGVPGGLRARGAASQAHALATHTAQGSIPSDCLPASSKNSFLFPSSRGAGCHPSGIPRQPVPGAPTRQGRPGWVSRAALGSALQDYSASGLLVC